MKRPTALLALLTVASLATAAACSGGGSGANGTPTPTASPTPSPSVSPCARTLAPADRTRFAVVSHPYDSSAGQANEWEVLALSSSGALSQTGATFTMGRATNGRVVFTPDGEIGLVAQEDGSIGVFRIAADGSVTVLNPGLTGDFYAFSVSVVPDGSRAIVVDGDTAENGGGLYELDIACDGTVAEAGMIAGARTPSGLEFLPDGRAVAAALELLSAPAGSDAELLQWDGTAAPSLLGGADAFGDDESIVSALAVTSGARYALIADDNQFSGTPNRIAITRIDAAGLSPVQILSPFNDPAAIAVSPFDGTALAILGEGNAIHRLAFDAANATAPYTDAGAITYSGAAPQLPLVAVTIDRGSLAGRVLVAENLGVRQLDFAPGGTVTDGGLTSLGSGFTAITGALGIQP